MTNVTTSDTLKIALLFLNAFAGLIAAYPGPEIGAVERLICAALVAGCGATLLYLNPPGSKSVSLSALTPAQTRQVADELEKRMRANPHG